MIQKNNQRGKVYFIRHGESTSNERNIFAGVLDVGLTAFGELQANRAGLDIKKKGIKFDAVYVSHLKRAQRTCEIALKVAGALKNENTPIKLDYRLGERSFGIFAKKNRSLLQLSLGYKGFETFLYSHSEAPPGGENITAIYSRVSEFYQECIVPHLERGENVLVVCHQYVLEPLSLYLTNRPPSDYHPLNLPNGKALNEDEIKSFQVKESSGTAAFRKKINDLSGIWGILLNTIAFFMGMVLRGVTGIEHGINSTVFISFILFFLGLATFYTYLDIDFGTSAKKVSGTVKRVVYYGFILRWLIGIGLIFFFQQNVNSLLIVIWILWWMIPPALTSSIPSMLWGGNLYPSALLSRNLSIILPFMLIGVLGFINLGIDVKSLHFFYVILIFGLGIPAIVSQICRKNSPIESKRYSKEWKFIGVWSVIFMALLTGYQFTPETIFQDIFFSATIEGSIACLRQLGIAIGVFVLMRLITVFLTYIAFAKKQSPEKIDGYVLLVSPNFYLWASLVSSVLVLNNSYELKYALFWTSLLFFCVPFVEQSFIKSTFIDKLLKTTLTSSRISIDQIEYLFRTLDKDNSNNLDENEIAELVKIIGNKTTDEKMSKEVASYITTQLFQVLDKNNNKTIELDELKKYLSIHGLVINLNIEEK